MMEPNFIKYGPSNIEDQPQKSIGTIIYENLKSYNKNHRTVIVDSRNGRNITHQELLQMIAKLSINLNKMGLWKNDSVAIISLNNWKNLVTWLSMLMIGAKVTFLNPNSTDREFKHFFTICPNKFIFCWSQNINQILKFKNEFNFQKIVTFDEASHNFSDHLIFFDTLLENVDESEIHKFLPADLDPDQAIAMILCSSGTTGLPKGVMISNATLRSQIITYGNSQFLDINEHHVILLYLPMFHIFGIIVALGGILFHSKLIIMEKFNPDNFLKLIQDYKITKLFAVPTIMIFLMKTPLINNYDLSSIREILHGAGPITRDVQKFVAERFKHLIIQQLYGMTETGGIVTANPKNCPKFGSIGKIFENYRMKVADVATGRHLGPYQVGELCIGSDYLMKGYSNNEEETKAAFDSEGFLKSGDLGYYDEDDYFYIVDRIKEIIKFKGFQVSPTEIEGILLNHPAVKDAGVIGVPNERTGEAPLAFVVKQAGTDVSEAEIIHYVAENTSEHKRLFGGVKFIDQIPKNTSGKILRRKLREFL